MSHLVERLAKIKQNDVYFITCSKLVGNPVDSDYKHGFAGAPASKPVMTVGGIVDYMLQYFARDGRE